MSYVMKIVLNLQISEKEFRGFQESPDHTLGVSAPFCARPILWIGSIICTYHTVSELSVHLFVFKFLKAMSHEP